MRSISARTENQQGVEADDLAIGQTVVQRDLSAQGVGDFLGNRQPKAGSMGREAGGEGFEQLLGQAVRQALALIPDQQAATACIGFNVDAEFAADRRVLDGIEQQVADQFANQPGIAGNLCRVFVDFKIQILLRNQW